jgi:hypothetical protein
VENARKRSREEALEGDLGTDNVDKREYSIIFSYLLVAIGTL